MHRAQGRSHVVPLPLHNQQVTHLSASACDNNRPPALSQQNDPPTQLNKRPHPTNEHTDAILPLHRRIAGSSRRIVD
jgi:hypothetical protein